MFKIPVLTLFLAVAAVAAHADLLELSGFGGYTSLDMGEVNNSLGTAKASGASVTDINHGYLVGLDLRTGALIPVPFLSLGLKAEYIGAANPGGVSGTMDGEPYSIKNDASMLDAMLGLDFSIGIPATPLSFGLSAYGGYGEGLMQQSFASDGVGYTDLYYGGAFVGEGEARLTYKVVSVLNIYAFGGMRFANLGTFANPKQKFDPTFPVGETDDPDVDFTGFTGGLGLNLDF
jgi:hypothetical protein